MKPINYKSAYYYGDYKQPPALNERKCCTERIRLFWKRRLVDTSVNYSWSKTASNMAVCNTILDELSPNDEPQFRIGKLKTETLSQSKFGWK